MLEKDLMKIGNRMYEARRRKGMTQAQAAEAANISDRNYADIERGNVNMRIETMISICNALNISADELLSRDKSTEIEADEHEIAEMLSKCGEKEKQTAYKLLLVYLRSEL